MLNARVSSQPKIPGGTSSIDVSLYTERHLRLFLVVATIVASPWVAATVVTVWHHARS